MAKKRDNKGKKNDINMDDETMRNMNRFLSDLLAETAKNIASAEANGMPVVLGFNFNIDNRGAPVAQNKGRKEAVEAGNAVQAPYNPHVEQNTNNQLVDIMESKGVVTVIMEMRGSSEKEVEILCDGDHAEINAGKYHKMVKLPYNVNPESIKYHFKNGILEMTVEKEMEGKQQKREGKKAVK